MWVGFVLNLCFISIVEFFCTLTYLHVIRLIVLEKELFMNFRMYEQRRVVFFVCLLLFFLGGIGNKRWEGCLGGLFFVVVVFFWGDWE